MKRLLLILLCLPMIGFGQLTYVPDDNFEDWLETNGYGDGNYANDSVLTQAIDTITILNIDNWMISELTGIEDFLSLEYLYCRNNQLTTINLNNNTNLIELNCRSNFVTSIDVQNNTQLHYLSFDENQMTTIDLSGNPYLTALGAQSNQITDLDVSNNLFLWILYCWDNQLTALDLTSNSSLHYLNCQDNLLLDLDIKNGNNSQMIEFLVQGNEELYCINVDDSTWSTNNWNFLPQNNIEPWHYFSENCHVTTNLQEYPSNKALLKTIDLLGRETNQKNQPLLYLYDDGTVEKRIVIE
jgi:hypothetical protein